MSRDTLQNFYVKFSGWCAGKVHDLGAASFMPGFVLDWGNVAFLNGRGGLLWFRRRRAHDRRVRAR